MHLLTDEHHDIQLTVMHLLTDECTEIHLNSDAFTYCCTYWSGFVQRYMPLNGEMLLLFSLDCLDWICMVMHSLAVVHSKQLSSCNSQEEDLGTGGKAKNFISSEKCTMESVQQDPKLQRVRMQIKRFGKKWRKATGVSVYSFIKYVA